MTIERLTSIFLAQFANVLNHYLLTLQSNCGLNKLGPPSTAAFNAGVSLVIIGTPFSYIFYIRLTKSAKLQQIDQKNLSFVTICPPRFRRLSIPECIKNKYFPFNQNLNRIYFSINPFIYVILATTALRASAARSGSEGDIIAIMYRSSPPKKLIVTKINYMNP